MQFLPIRATVPITFDQYIEDFRVVAISAHGDQKYGDLPYAYHLASVETILTSFGYDSYEDRAVAWLHDTLEDTDLLFKTIHNHYGEHVAKSVYACSGEGENRKERNASIYKKLAEYPKAAPYKVADRLANVRQGIATRNRKALMYVREFPDFSQNLRPLMMDNQKDRVMWNALEEAIIVAVKYTEY